MAPRRAVLATALSFLLLATGASAATARVDVANEVVGQTPRYIGYNYGHYMPGSTTTPSRTTWRRTTTWRCTRRTTSPTAATAR
jgi:hypothetical protein